jgi:hypothetical protein
MTDPYGSILGFLGRECETKGGNYENVETETGSIKGEQIEVKLNDG